MAAAIFRFYEELNDFLPAHKRKQDLTVEFNPPVPVRHLIETLGVPHTEVEIILLNGESVPLDHPLADGDRVSVYPMFESVDVTPLLRLRERPLRNPRPRFLADAHLGRLAGYLRMLGFDTLFGDKLEDRELAELSSMEQRILLTRDRALLMHRIITHGCYIRASRPRDQLSYLVERLDLCVLMQPFTRCIRCNGVLQAVEKGEVAPRLPSNVRTTRAEFRRCIQCRQVYWAGSHYQRMHSFIHTLCQEQVDA